VKAGFPDPGGNRLEKDICDIGVIEVAYNPGVTDPVARSVRKAIRDPGTATVMRGQPVPHCPLYITEIPIDVCYTSCCH